MVGRFIGLRLKFRYVPVVLAAVLIIASGLPSSANPMTEAQKEGIEAVVRDYLLKNPEIIVEAVKVLKARKRQAKERAATAALHTNWSQLFDDPTSPVGGNPNGDITVIEFFDYRCGVCKQMHPTIAKLIASDSNIRRVYKEWPILGPNSVLAARAALASHQQGKYFSFHDAMMKARLPLNRDAILSIAKRLDLDISRLVHDMDGPDISHILERNLALAKALNFKGTPSFVIEDTLLRGAEDLSTMHKLVAAARANKKQANKAKNN